MSDKRLKMPVSCAQVVLKYYLDGQPVENVLYAQKWHTDTGALVGDGGAPAAFDVGAADDVATNVKTWLTDHWAPVAGAQAQATELDVIWSTVAGTGPLEGRTYSDDPFPVVGSVVGAPLPNNVTCAVEMKTPLLGRSYHGRSYFVGMTDHFVDSTEPNQIKASEEATLPALFQLLHDGLNGWHSMTAPADRYPLGVMSFVHGGAPRSTALFTVMHHFALSDPWLDSQRRRLPGHNRHR